MGGIWKHVKVTWALMWIGSLALAGVPFFAGFYSKDTILEAAWGSQTIAGQGAYWLGCAAAFLTAFYSWRLLLLTFHGRPRADEHVMAHVHESPAVMTVPLMILAGFAILLGLIGTPAWPWFDGYLNGEGVKVDFAKLQETAGLMGVSALIVISGISLGIFLYGKRQRQTSAEQDVLEAAQPALFKLLQKKYYIDEFYEATVIRFNEFAAWLCDFFDQYVFGGLVKLVSYVTVGLSWAYRLMDENYVNFAFDDFCEGLRKGGGGISKMHTGRVQTYLRIIGVALVALVIMLVWGHLI